MTRKSLTKGEIPKLRSKEFKFIRKNSGITQEFFALSLGRRSKGTVWHWEQNRYMPPYLVKQLINLASREVFDACRKLYADRQEEIRKNNEAYLRNVQAIRDAKNK